MKKSSLFRLFLVMVMVSGVCFSGSAAKEKAASSPLDESVLKGLKLRCIGPANMGGRIDDIAVVENNSHVIYVGTASGGIWKTTNNGTTWEPIFDELVTSTIGDLAVSLSHPDILWVGTGEPNNRQSSSWGNGVYRSTDGGKTWENMGLEDTHHIGRIIIHPANPDVVYVAALGHLWGPNKQRGLFRTQDGGKTWVNTKFISENTGFVDVAMDPENPNTLYAAAYQRRRRGWGFNGGGPESGLYKTTNGGETWIKLTHGLPKGDTGRIGIDVYRNDTRIVYAIVENKDGGVFRSEDKGFSWERMSDTNPRPMYYSQIRIDPNNDQRIWILGADMYVSQDGGKTFQRDYVSKVHGDHHAMWINPTDSNHMVLGSDGGVYFSNDRGNSWDFVNTIPLAQFYEIGFDMRRPYFVYGGLQDNGSWGGPSATWYRQGITNDEWIKIGGGDGFYTQVDPEDYNVIYVESQNGNLSRFHLNTGEDKSIRPQPSDPKEQYRFNWNSPIVISPHDPKTVYYGGNKLFISEDRGETWKATQDLTTQQDREKLPLMGVLPTRNTLSRHDGISHYGDITSISESPLKKGLFYVGTDDGNLQVSQDGGETWTNIISNIPRVPKKVYVSRVIASHFDEGTAYVTLDGHRNDDFRPYVYSTGDYGKTWRNITGNLLVGSVVNVIREHPKNPNLLFVGTERGAYFSIDKGTRWVKIKANFPVVPVDDIAIHPRENDLILGTHGRSMWILDDITCLEQLTKEALSSPAFLFGIRSATVFNPFSHKGNLGHKFFVAPNPPAGAIINYYLKQAAEGEVKILVQGDSGEKITEFKGTSHAGINRMTWNLRYQAPDLPIRREDSRYQPEGPFVLPGEYQVILTAGGKEMSQRVQVELDPRVEVTSQALKARQDILMNIYRHSRVFNTAHKWLEAALADIKGVEKALKRRSDIPDIVNESVSSISKGILGIQIDLFGDPRLGRRGRRNAVMMRLLSLSRSISGFTGEPTPYQIAQVELLKNRLISDIAKMNELIEQKIPNLNKLLKEHDILGVVPGERIQIR